MDNKYKKIPTLTKPALSLVSSIVFISTLTGFKTVPPKLPLEPTHPVSMSCHFAINDQLGCQYMPDESAPLLAELTLDLNANGYFSGIVKVPGSAITAVAKGTELVLPAPTQSVPYPNIAFQKWDPSWNWLNAGGIRFNVTNPSNEPLKIFFKLADSSFFNAYMLFQEIPANTTQAVDFRFNGLSKNLEGYSKGGEEPDLSNMVQLEFFAAGDVGKQTFVINDIAFIDLDDNQKLAACSIDDYEPLEELQSITNFSGGNMEKITRQSGVTTKVENYQGNDALKLDIKANESGYPGLEFSNGADGSGAPWDWSKQGNAALAIDVANPGTDTVQLYLRIDDELNQDYGGEANGAVNSRNGTLVVQPNPEFTTYYFPISAFESSFETGMRGQPESDYDGLPISFVWGDKKLDTSQIYSFLLYQAQPAKDSTVYLDNIRLVKDVSDDRSRYQSIIDPYGQFIKDDWVNKITSDEELACLGHEDKELVKKVKPLPDRSKFGGYAAKDAPKLTATGYFRVEKYKGRWMFVDPEGHLYWATGLDNARMDDTNTITGVAFSDQPQDSSAALEPSEVFGEGYLESKRPRSVQSDIRHNLFTWLPDYTDLPMAENYAYAPFSHKGALNHGEVFSFYQANLMRKYQTNSLEETLSIWKDVAVARMLDWGFTSLGNWSDISRLYRNGKIPYTAHAWIPSGHKTIASSNDYWAPTHDPFDPAFRTNVKKTVADVAANTQDDPYLIGTFVENELSWGDMVVGNPARRYDLAISTLALNADDSPAKQYFVAQLQKQYGKVSALNKAWQTRFSSWDAVAGNIDIKQLPAPTSTTGIDSQQNYERDLATFMVALSGKFFQVIKEELKAVMPNHLYLGSRFSDWGVTPEVQIGAAKHVDVMSYNLYAEKPLDLVDFSTLEKLDMPAMVGEFHFGSLDSGLFSLGIVAANDQEDRGKKYNKYMSSVLSHPNFVGAHWFQYTDSPTTGRAWDGENYNVGFVQITDVPYLPLVNAAKAFNENMYKARLDLKIK
ncbi:beta-agarase [Marinomonas agarivorans]|nr:beta-agarase [Marinomonas agarivorans]